MYRRITQSGSTVLYNLRNVNSVTLDKTRITFAYTNTNAFGWFIYGSGMLNTSEHKEILTFPTEAAAAQEFEVIEKSLKQQRIVE